MEGGIDAWNGLVAGGAYEAGLAYFSRASRAEELISLSFALEEGNRVFYERISQDLKEGEAASIFRSMGQAEERHKETLRELHARISGKSGNPAHPEGMEAGGFLEGGAPLKRRSSGPRERRWRRSSNSPSRWRRTPWTVTSRWGGRSRTNGPERSSWRSPGKNRNTWSG